MCLAPLFLEIAVAWLDVGWDRHGHSDSKAAPDKERAGWSPVSESIEFNATVGAITIMAQKPRSHGGQGTPSFFFSPLFFGSSDGIIPSCPGT